MLDTLVGWFDGFWSGAGYVVIVAAVVLAARYRLGPWGAPRPAVTGKALPPAIVEACALHATPEAAVAAQERVFPDQDAARVARMFAEFGFSFAPDGSFATHPGPEAVRRVVDALFAPADRDAVLAELARYGKARHEIWPGRLRLDILKESGGDPQAVKRLVGMARRDFRDVVVMAESPRFLRGVAEGSGEALMTLVDPRSDAHLAVADADLRQFGMWLLQYVR